MQRMACTCGNHASSFLPCPVPSLLSLSFGLHPLHSTNVPYLCRYINFSQTLQGLGRTSALHLHLIVRPIPYHQPLDFVPNPSQLPHPAFFPSPATSLPTHHVSAFHLEASNKSPEVMSPEWHPQIVSKAYGKSHMRPQNPNSEECQLFLACSSTTECSARRSRRSQVLLIQLHGTQLVLPKT